MQKVVYKKSYQGSKPGDVAMVSNNYAHFLLEKGVADIFQGRRQVKEIKKAGKNKIMKSSEDKMMRTKEKDNTQEETSTSEEAKKQQYKTK